MSWRGITRRALERVAENRIRQAMEEGVFDNLPAEGRPIEGLDQPYDPLWWVKQWIERENLQRLPEERRRLWIAGHGSRRYPQEPTGLRAGDRPGGARCGRPRSG